MEILIVICVAAILMTIAGIQYSRWITRYSVEREIKEMYADLMSARSMAMSRNRIHFVNLTATGYTVYDDTNTAPDGNGILETATGKDTPRTVKSLTYPITWPGGWTPANPLEFDPRGIMTTVPTGVIRITGSYGADYDCIMVEQTRLTLGSWNGANCIIR